MKLREFSAVAFLAVTISTLFVPLASAACYLPPGNEYYHSQLGLAKIGGDIYLVAWDNDVEYIYKIDVNCNVLAKYNTTQYIFGLTYDGVNFWSTSDISYSRLVKLNETFNEVGEIKLPYGAPEDIEYSNGKIWTVYNTAKDEITATDVSTGQTELKFYSPNSAPYGLTAENDYVWVAGDYTVYKLSKSNGTVVAQIASPATGGYPSGLAYDGSYIWLVDNNDNKLYSINPNQATTTTTTVPATTTTVPTSTAPTTTTSLPSVTTTTTVVQCVSGCMYGGACVSFGTRIAGDAAMYCDINAELKPQKAVNEACQNGYECESNNCKDGLCKPTCNGCAYNNNCVPIGIRKKSQYCSIDQQMVWQKAGDEACENDFECASNSCLDQKCVQEGLLQAIIRWFLSVLPFDV